MKRSSIRTNNHNQIIRNLQYSYPSSPFGDWTIFNTNNPHGYFSWDKSIYPDGIRFNNIGSGGWYYSGELAELSQTVTFGYPQVRTIYIGDMVTTKDNQSVQIWVDGALAWQDYDSGTPTQKDIYFPAGTYEFKIRYRVAEDCYGAPACNLNHVYRIMGYSPPPPPPGNLTINITPPDAVYNVIDSLGNTVASNVPSGTTVSNLIPDTYSSILTRTGYQDKSLIGIVIGPGEYKILTDTLIPLPCPVSPKYEGNTVTLNATPKDGTGPYYVVFKKNGVDIDQSRLGGLPNPIIGALEDIQVTRVYTLNDEDIMAASTGTIDFSVYITDSCPTGAKSCTGVCTITIGCIAPVCNFTII